MKFFKRFKGERSKSGDPVYRYDKKKEFEAPDGDSNIEEISDHVERHIGKISNVFHELISDKVHIDIHIVEPTVRYPFYTLVTSGMSDKPMNTPEGLESLAYSELCISLPSDWKLSQEDFEDEQNYWPVRWLKILARFPHEYDTWLGVGHTIPNGDPPEPFAENTGLSSIILLPAAQFGEEFVELQLPNKTINFFAVTPLYNEELELKLSDGTEALLTRFDEQEVEPILYVNRRSTV